MQYVADALFGLLVITIAILLGIAGVVLIQRLMPVHQRAAYNSAMGPLYGGLYVMFGVIIGFTAFLVLNKFNAAQTTVQSEADDIKRIYLLAKELPQTKRDEIQGLAESYARVVVEEEWPLMRQNQTSPHAQALANSLRNAIQEFKPATSTQPSIYAQELNAVNELDNDRAARLLEAGQSLPPILWIALFGLSITMLLFACLIGIEDTRIHMLGVATLAASIALVLFTIHLLDRPFGTALRVGPQPFELVLHQIEARR